VPSASTSTVLNDALPITFKVNLLSGWIAGFATAILPAQADVQPFETPAPRTVTDECGLEAAPIVTSPAKHAPAAEYGTGE
jgi:hypothetical protein